MNTTALIATLFLGAFVLMGAAAVFITKNSSKIVNFTMGAAFVVMLLLVFFEILPEAFEISMQQISGTVLGIAFPVAFTALGIGALKLLDLMMPGHKHHSEDEKLTHIGIITSIAIIIHNLVEGAGVYAVYSSNISMGVLMCISVGLHNIPIGMMVGSSFYGKKDSAFQFAMYIFGVAFSPFAGGLVVHLLKLELEGTLLACALLSSSCGMLLFIAFMELLPEIREHIRHKEIIYGLAAGAAFFICGMLLA